MSIAKAITLVAATLCLCSAAAAAHSAAEETLDQQSMRSVSEAMATLQMPFIANQGQITDPGVRFFARTFAGTVFVTDANQLVYSLPAAGAGDAPLRWAFRESFRGAKSPHPRGADPSEIRVSHYKGYDPQGWYPRLETFDGVDLGELYPGVRVSLRAAGNNVEKLFRVAPGGEVGGHRHRYRGCR